MKTLSGFVGLCEAGVGKVDFRVGQIAGASSSEASRAASSLVPRPSWWCPH